MKFVFFHLMPYADLDLDYDRDHGSAWVTLPNSYYDPVKGHELYNRYLDELEYADQLGFDGVCVNEHHQTAYGLMPAPNVLAGALARRTRNAKICILGRALPLVSNPLTIAEEFALLDNLTGGRIVTGFVRGIGAEYHTMGVNPTESHDRFHEAHDLIVRAWTEKGPFSFEGKYYHYNYVNLWPRPFQNPHPPIWIPSQGSSETIRWASAKERRYTYLQTQTPLPMLYKYMNMYREEARKAGYEPSPDQLGWSIKIYVGETDEIAVREAQPHVEAFVNKFLRMPMEMLLPPGYLSLASMKGVMQAKKGITSGARTIHDLMEQGTFICGSPATVRERLLEIQSKAGFNTVLPGLQFGTLPEHLTRKNTELFAREVMPYLRDAVPDFARMPTPA
ncbi:LLM class flavin-dependent oxidoreductase [Bradyrhizobium sp. U87765 SZCCT0131]|uniref:LLM class flavin-dependent oxidoreductase n=1 Tax=unclassified Bradyrhizobium TaxID=2631580 RepID=UPI001BA78B66|nr:MULTISPECIES: LLM class flavin-dependent oxidoreductase [unclassified Bradyrhizobium]MBR1221398.1 LLM class flavin-dependent oxidoreductase [Bradyrhizobium sp. U87765 SZCCT0131]MBR1264679.1 LLM class flavin-dependent oxidoreductase [Bradyrhizobium sp. U87765 SZCCT0134]MBR1304415.1 LLM class flavin-dependent oxidoreductase [Bradyrhizobium sp. U87765 SZCCT0110]MBR1322728.1 LLM class flavin-dependent oxidoreductase [Bradyrhizobium sp. U87765 SZCCT0109]MBR1346344.1 LLM class flavin-dependent ox